MPKKDFLTFVGLLVYGLAAKMYGWIAIAMTAAFGLLIFGLARMIGT